MVTYLQDAQTRQLDELSDWLRIPSISTLSQHKEDVAQAASWLAQKMTAIGLENVELIQTGGHPIVYGDWLNAGADAPTILIYGHYDVQPVDPLELWISPPFEPTVRGNDLFARGASDDKGQLFAHVAAVEALLETFGALPVNVKFLWSKAKKRTAAEVTDGLFAGRNRKTRRGCLSHLRYAHPGA